MPDSINRVVLPVHDQNHVGLAAYDAKDPKAAFPPIDEARPPEGSPNVLINLLHDATSVSDDDTPQTSRFTGSVDWVQLDQGADDSSHLTSPEDRLRVAMVRQ
jgi:hypothetical protein